MILVWVHCDFTQFSDHFSAMGLQDGCIVFHSRMSTLCFQGLLTDGSGFESYPASLTLPAESGVLPVKLSGLTKESGELAIIGEWGEG